MYGSIHFDVKLIFMKLKDKNGNTNLLEKMYFWENMHTVKPRVFKDNIRIK